MGWRHLGGCCTSSPCLGAACGRLEQLLQRPNTNPPSCPCSNQQRRAVASPDQRGFYDAASSDDEFADAEDVWLLSQEHAGASQQQQQQQQQLGSQEQTQLAHAQQSQEPQPPSQPGSAAASPEQRRGSQGPALPCRRLAARRALCGESERRGAEQLLPLAATGICRFL